MIQPSRFDFLLRTNSVFAETYTLASNGAAVDLTGVTSISMKIRRNAAGAVLTTIVPTVVSPAAAGGIEINIPIATIVAVYNDVVTEATLGDTVVLEYDMVFVTASMQQVWLFGNVQIIKGITE